MSLFLKRRLPRCRPDCIKSLLNKIFKQPAKENTPLYVCKSLRTLHGRGAWKLGRLWTRDDHDNPTSAAHIGYHVNFTRYVILTVHMLCHIVKRESCDRFGKKVQNGKAGTVNIVTLFHCTPSGNDSKNAIKIHRDLNSDSWIQSPEC